MPSRPPKPATDSVRVKITPQGWFLIALSIVLFYAAMNIRSGWLFTLDFCLVGLAVSSWSIGYFSFSGKTAGKRAVADCFAGETVSANVILKNEGKFNQYLLSVEKKVFVAYLPLAQSAAVTYRIKAGKRGVYALNELSLEGAALGGFFAFNKTIACPGRWVVYPNSRPCSLNPAFQSVSLRRNDSGPSDRMKGGDDFVGIRDYEPGESIRTIHWPSSAKVGILRARDTREAARMPFSFYIDLDGSFGADRFERLIETSAFALTELLKNGYEIRMMRGNGFKTVNRFEGLEILAGLQSNRQSLAGQIKALTPILQSERNLLIFSESGADNLPDEVPFTLIKP